MEKRATEIVYTLIPKVKPGEENANFRKPIRIEEDAIRCRGRWKQLSEGGQPRATTPVDVRYIVIVAKRNRRVTSTRVTSMVTASIGRAISAATVSRIFQMNGLYARVSRVCVPLSIQSRAARLKWCREHGNQTVSDWHNVMFTDESRFALEPDDKHIRIWRKQGTCNQPQNITEHHAFRG
ncbi:HTH_Tnp_Tc3_2 domain-containing protein [Trichonephila clavipes]|nr:HTH_Tnp_Tc3_2 domain-containing protein [Trichonephila clavipes]